MISPSPVISRGRAYAESKVEIGKAKTVKLPDRNAPLWVEELGLRLLTTPPGTTRWQMVLYLSENMEVHQRGCLDRSFDA
jgi:hypothetical protein